MTSGKLAIKEKIGYGLGDTASNLYWTMFTNFLLFFYTDVFGITAAAAGTMLLISRFWDSINDPMMGIIADRTKSKWGRFRPYMIWISGPLAILGVLTFMTPDLSLTGKIIYAYVTYTLIMMAYTAINIPFAALMGVMTPNIQERTSISTYKFVLAFVGVFIIQGATLPLVKFFGKGNQAVGFPATMAVFGVMACIFFYLSFRATHERVQPPTDKRTPLKKDLNDLIHNRPWKFLLLMGFFTLASIVVRNGTILYYFKYYIGNEILASLFMVLGTVAVIVGVCFTQFFTKMLGKKKLYLIVMSLTSLLTLLYYFIPKDQIILVFAAHILISLVMAPQGPLLWAMYADTADYSEWKNGRRATGLIFSASTFAQKFGVALGGGLAGYLLTVYGFVPNVEQSETTLKGIRLMMSFFPTVLLVVATIAAVFYELDDKTMSKIEKELIERRAEKAKNP